jgi:F0F1-type ATP synthase membrane subunit b/b'
MKRSLTILRWIVAPPIALAFAAVALCTEQGESSTEQTVGGIFKWIHFIILAGVAYWLFKKVLPPVFRRNRDKISDSITKATAAKAEAEEKLQAAAAKLASLEQEVAHFRAQAQNEAAAELARLRGMTKTDLEKVSIAAQAEVEAAERAARVELRALAAKLAVDRAESLVATQMTPAVQEAMINSFVESLQGRPN